MTVVYLDSVFLLNGAMDYLLFLFSATLAGIPLRRRRYLLAAFLGGIYAVACFLPGLEGLGSLAGKGGAGILLGLVAFGREERLGRLLLLSCAVACAMAGCVLGLSFLSGTEIPGARGIFYTDVNGSVLLLTAAGVYFVTKLVFRAAARQGVQGRLIPVTLCAAGRKKELTALWDSGNCLRNPMDGSSVLVVAPEVAEVLLPPEARHLLTRSALRDPVGLLELLTEAAPGLRLQLLPYRAVGTAGALLLAFRCDWAEIGGRRHEALTVALSPDSLGDGYSALWGGEVGKGGRHEETLAMDKRVAGCAGAQGRDILYRWQRYSSAAVGPGPGGGTAGSHGRGSGAGRTDRTQSASGGLYRPTV